MIHRTFTPFPILTTERLTLRQVSLNDEQDIFNIRSDAAMNKYLDRQPCKAPEDARNFINIISEAIRNNESIYWAITLTDSGTFLGTICLFDFSDQQQKCEIGFELLSKFQRQGIMLEAARKVMEFATRAIHIQTVEAYVHKDNLHSIQLLEKLGFNKTLETDTMLPHLQVFTFGQKR